MTDDEERPRMIDARALVGVGEIAALFMVSRTTVSNWEARADRNGYPPAVAYLMCGPIYDVNEVVKWYAAYKPLKGGRPGREPKRVEGAFAPSI